MYIAQFLRATRLVQALWLWCAGWEGDLARGTAHSVDQGRGLWYPAWLPALMNISPTCQPSVPPSHATSGPAWVRCCLISSALRQIRSRRCLATDRGC